MGASVTTYVVKSDQNKVASQKRPSQSVTLARGEVGRLAKLCAFVKPRETTTPAVEEIRPPKKQTASSCQTISASWTEVINDPVLWKELREVVLDDADDYIA